jgi:hypothetical protein
MALRTDCHDGVRSRRCAHRALRLFLPRMANLSLDGPALPLSSRFVLSKEQMSCELSGEIAIVNLKNGVYYGIDPVGARVWQLLHDPVTVAEICDALGGEFEVDRPRLESDISTFIGELAQHGLIEIAS